MQKTEPDFGDGKKKKSRKIKAVNVLEYAERMMKGMVLQAQVATCLCQRKEEKESPLKKSERKIAKAAKFSTKGHR